MPAYWTSDAGLLPFRDLDDVLVLTDLAGEALTDIRTGQKSRHTLIAQLDQPRAPTPTEPHPGLEQWPSLAVTCCEEFILGGPPMVTIAVLKRLAVTLLVVAAVSGPALLVV